MDENSANNMDGNCTLSYSSRTKNNLGREPLPGSELWMDGLICAFEFVRGHPPKGGPKKQSNQRRGDIATRHVPFDISTEKSNDKNLSGSMPFQELNDTSPFGVSELSQFDDRGENDRRHIELSESHWVPIGWKRLKELVQTIKVDGSWVSQPVSFVEGEEDMTVADLASPYWEKAGGPTWWCHVDPNHDIVSTWLSNAKWLHPAISVALRDESRLISERMKHLLYEVPVRVAGGLLFELLGQSVGDPFRDEDDIPIVLRSWYAQNFLVTTLHVKGYAENINVLGITEVQELLYAGGSSAPKSVHEVIAHLACRLSRWDDRRNHEDMNLLSVILNQEIRRLSSQVIRVKWSLHAREEIIFELLQHLRGISAKIMMEGIKKSTRQMLAEQEAVRGRLFTMQDVMQSTVRAWLQDRSLRVTHNLAVFGGCGMVLSIITGLFGINVDGIPGATQTPYAFGLFTGLLFLTGIVLIGLGMLYLGLKKPVNEEQVHVRKLELQQLVSMFQHEAETHAKVRDRISRHNLPPTAADMIPRADYILID